MEVPVFYPTPEEFQDFIGYVEKLEREHKVHEIGLCKVGFFVCVKALLRAHINTKQTHMHTHTPTTHPPIHPLTHTDI